MELAVVTHWIRMTSAATVGDCVRKRKRCPSKGTRSATYQDFADPDRHLVVQVLSHGMASR